jgi:hypothetical protein
MVSYLFYDILIGTFRSAFCMAAPVNPVRYF